MRVKAAPPRSPFRWAGGKRRLAPRIIEMMPPTFEGYYEPFVGGGSVFLELAGSFRFTSASLSDVNWNLIAAWRAIQTQPRVLWREIHAIEPSAETYQRVRSGDIRMSPAGRMLWLNRTCFNGLHRVDAQGRYNAPYGKRDKLSLDWREFDRVSRALEGVNLGAADFVGAIGCAGFGDVVYCDPPYLPASKTASFSRYAGDFGPDHHRALRAACDAAVARDAFVIVSEADTPETREIWDGWRMAKLKVSRPISSKGSTRGPVGELLLTPPKGES